jgi:hypothetical protein
MHRTLNSGMSQVIFGFGYLCLNPLKDRAKVGEP